MRVLPLLSAVMSLIPAVAWAGPKCPPLGAGPQSTNWGGDFRDRIQQVFDRVKSAAGAGIDPQTTLINVNDLGSGARLVDGSPLLAVQKGTQGLTHDAVLYTYGVFELACDEAQLAFFMAHEMRHIKRGADGKNHFDQVTACRRQVLQEWMGQTDLSAYPDDKSALAAFDKAKGTEVQTRCVRPVENEADQFAVALAPQLPWKVESDPDSPDPNRDARVLAFRNAEKWLQALGLDPSDPGHGTMAERADATARAAQAQAEQRLQKSLPNGGF